MLAASKDVLYELLRIKATKVFSHLSTALWQLGTTLYNSGDSIQGNGTEHASRVLQARNRTELVISVLLWFGRTTAFSRGVSKAGNVIWERQLASLTVSFCQACLLLTVMLIYLNSKRRPSGWCCGRQKHRKRLSSQFTPTPTTPPLSLVVAYRNS